MSAATPLPPGRTAIVFDSTADYPQGLARHRSLRMVPLTVSFGDEDFRDYVDLGADAFYARLTAGGPTPKTAAPAPQAFADVYGGLLDGDYDQVVSLHISGKLSATVEAARAAAQGFPGRVHVHDTRLASAATALCVVKVLEMIEAGTTAEEVAAYVERFGRAARLLFSVDTLEYLQRGGRIGRAQALLGSMLSVKPILGFDDGEVHPLGRVRGASKVIGAFEEQLRAGSPDAGPLRVGFAHANVPEAIARMADMVRRVRPEATVEIVTTLGAVIGTYAGPGAFGMMWTAEPPTPERPEEPV